MTSRFWKYFHDTLCWAQIDAPGPLAAVIKGLAHRLDKVREDALFLRDQAFPQRCRDELVPMHGYTRGLTIHHTEMPEQFRQRVTNAYAWHMLGGKWEGLPQILKFYGFDIAELESMSKYQSSRWAEFQIGLLSPANFEEQNTALASLETLVWLINEYKPARSVLARLYNDIHNITPLIWSHGRYSEHFYSHFSGVPATDLGGDWKDKDLLLSFGHRLGIEAHLPSFDGTAFFSGWQDMGIEARYVDAPVWSHFAYSDNFPEKHGFTMFNLLVVDWSERIIKDGVVTWDRILPDWMMGSTQRARSELVYSDEFLKEDTGVWSGKNACYGVPTAHIVKKPPIWGSYLYSGDVEGELVSIHERFYTEHGIITEPCEVQPPETLIEGETSVLLPPLHNQSWTGHWDSRCWWNYHAYTSFF